MKIPAIRANIGTWKYYVSTLTFKQVASLVKKIDDELHKSESLREQIQRSITDNYINIKNYILNQDERFFNSLVLAVYNGVPKWNEVELVFEEVSFFNLGLLEFDGSEKIFPVDGQHRVEGIKAALLENPELENEKIAVILIGHVKDDAGMQKTRRLFTTLNRYARPVNLKDIIALDEDDIVAISTRELLENNPLFTGKRISNSEQKHIQENDKYSLTSLVTFYQANLEIYKTYVKEHYGVNPTKTFLLEKQKYRPNDIDLKAFQSYLDSFWKSFSVEFSAIQEYLSIDQEPGKKFRNRETGGNLLFRPIAFIPFVQSVLEIHKRLNLEFNEIFKKLDKIDLTISNRPFEFTVWNPIDKTMVMGNKTLIKLFLIYLFDDLILSNNELRKLKEKYAFLLNQKENIDTILDGIK